MGNKLTQTQEQRQEQKLVQAITQQQLLQAQLVELPITQLLERINTEMDDNPALEVNADAPDDLESQDFLESQEDDEDFDSQQSFSPLISAHHTTARISSSVKRRFKFLFTI